jgi:hypothetical protein
MWADTLLALERGHLLRLALWGGGSVLAGTALLAWLTLGRRAAPLLRHFAIQCAAWGAVDLAIVAWAWRGLALRDFAGAQGLVNFLWFNVGLDAGYVAVGATLALTAWRWGPRPGGVGAGTGVIVQGMALALLDLRLVALIGPVR